MELRVCRISPWPHRGVSVTENERFVLVTLCQGHNREKNELIFIDCVLCDEISYIIVLKILFKKTCSLNGPHLTDVKTESQIV